MPKPITVLDTNVLISGLLILGSYSQRIIEAWYEEQIIVYASPELIQEFIKTIKLPKINKRYRIHQTDIDNLTHALNTKLILLNTQNNNFKLRDPKDNYLLNLFSQARADYLITGDKDLLSIASDVSFKIVSPKTFCQLFNL